jgi:hypothetical protein
MKEVIKAVEKAVLNARDHKVIGRAFASALDQRDNTGSLVHTVCDVARQCMKGKAFAEPDLQGIVDVIAHERGWEGASLKSRGSEVRVVLRAYVKLPEAIKIAQRDGACNWHFSMMLARKINAGSSPADAVEEAREKGSKKKANTIGKIAGLLKTLYKDNRSKRDAAIKAWKALGIEGDIA